MNPIEDEAVVHRILAETAGHLQLVNAADALPGLKYSKGKESWLVGSRDLEFYENFEQVPEKWRTTIRPQMFPPKEGDREKFGLNRCVRILPHQQNTGGFFVAVLEKTKPINPSEKFMENLSAKRPNEDGLPNLPQNQRKRRRTQGFKEDPFVFFKSEETVWPEIKSFYDVNDSFDVNCLLVRCHTGKKKNIYYASPAIRDLVVNNQDFIKFINTGVKCFVRSDNRNMKCAFRIANDGLETLFPYMGDARKVKVLKEDLINVLVNDKPEKSPPIDTLSESVQKQVKELSPGSCVLIYEEEVPGGKDFVLRLSGWRGTSSLRSYMTQHSTVHLLRLLGEDTSKYGAFVSFLFHFIF